MTSTAKRNKNLSRMATVRVYSGMDLRVLCRRMADQGNAYGLRVVSVFNDITIVSQPGMTQDQIYQIWERESRPRNNKWKRSFRAEIARRESEEKDAWRQCNKKKILRLLKKERVRVPLFKYLEFKRVVNRQSKNDYGRKTLAFAFGFAVLMQQALKKGECFESAADHAFKEADYMITSGDQSGKAMSFLSKYWKFGKELNIWMSNKWKSWE